MLNFSSEPTRRNTFNQFSTTFRRIFNPILLNGRKSKTKDLDKTSRSSKLIEECKNSKVYPASTDHPIEISLNTPNHSKEVEKECPICLLTLPKTSKKLECGHISCDSCLIKYLKTEISESRISITCPECITLLHPNRIQQLLVNDQHYLNKYEEFLIRKVLVTDPDTRYCPAPDCSYAVIASNCSKCPILKCGRQECKTLFCFNCQKKCTEEHKCKATANSSSKTKSTRKLKKSKRNSTSTSIDKPDRKEAKSKLDSNKSSSEDLTISTDLSTEDNVTNLSTSEFLNRFNMKPCPACRILIIKIEDGSCNHMTCSVCGCQFCWLCMKKTSELHYLSPSGCTFFGKRQWSKKKKLFWQLGMLLGAPVFIALSAAIAVPSIVIGVPVWFGRKLQNKLSTKKLGKMGKFKKCVFVTSGVISSAIISPVLAAGAVAIGIPFLLAYVYGIIPITLCRSKVQMSDSKEQPISDEEAQAFLKQLSEKDNRLTMKEKASKKKSSKRSSKDKELNTSSIKSKDKYQLLNRLSTQGSFESIQNQSTKATKGSLNEFFDFELSLVEDSTSKLSATLSSSSKDSFSSASSLEASEKKKIIKEELKIVEVHCDRFGKLSKSNSKKLEVKSLENLAQLNYCEKCDTSHMPCVKKIVHRPCCPNFRD